ncbi:hypothetical protein XENOCAPTIV_009877 [Xenoophorus captivus]|uniref:Uncharacterized protein n=1 Tax=Xenoophorus captivus TaxID=1517983 RepID=A0ABV0RC33_9TELE
MVILVINVPKAVKNQILTNKITELCNHTDMFQTLVLISRCLWVFFLGQMKGVRVDFWQHFCSHCADPEGCIWGKQTLLCLEFEEDWRPVQGGPHLLPVDCWR